MMRDEFWSNLILKRYYHFKSNAHDKSVARVWDDDPVTLCIGASEKFPSWRYREQGLEAEIQHAKNRLNTLKYNGMVSGCNFDSEQEWSWGEHESKDFWIRVLCGKFNYPAEASRRHYFSNSFRIVIIGTVKDEVAKRLSAYGVCMLCMMSDFIQLRNDAINAFQISTKVWEKETWRIRADLVANMMTNQGVERFHCPLATCRAYRLPELEQRRREEKQERRRREHHQGQWHHYHHRRH